MAAEPKWCEAHMVRVSGSGTDDREVDMLHPESCPFEFMFAGVSGEAHYTRSYRCAPAFEVEQGAYDTILDGVTEDGWYEVRMRHVTIRGATWSEIDLECETVRVGAVVNDGY